MLEHIESHQEHSEGHAPPHPQRRVTGSILLLVGIAGCFDAIGYLGLGHVFTANMTGNTVLLALNIGQETSQQSFTTCVRLQIATTALTSPLATLMTELAKWVDFRTRAASRTTGVTGSQVKPDVIGRTSGCCMPHLRTGCSCPHPFSGRSGVSPADRSLASYPERIQTPTFPEAFLDNW
jgi:Protein of unknown function (DUF1275)